MTSSSSLRAVTVLLVVACAALSISATAGATAASATTVPTAFQIGTFTPESHEVELPSVQVDASGTAYAAWQDLGTNLVDYCVLPDGATACAESGALTPVNEPGGNYGSPPSAPTLSGYGRGVDLTIDGGTVSIVASVTGPSISGYGGENTETEEWQAPDGSANFTLVNHGNSVAYPKPGTTYTYDGTQYITPSYMTGGVTVPGTGELGEFDFAPGGPPTFEAYPLGNPPACSEQSTPPCAVATLEPASNPDPVSNYSDLLERQIASEDGQNAGILGIDETYDATGPFACTATVAGDSSPEHTSDAYVYGSGEQSATNNYSISPGQPDSAWKVPATQIPNDCPAHELAVAGGPSGLGLLETSMTGNSTMNYLPLDAATGAFDQPAVTVDANATAGTPDLAQDGAGNLYATGFVQQLSGGQLSGDAPLGLYYSGNGGTTWEGPGPLETTLQTGFSRQQIAVGADGKGWMVITTSQGTVDALEFTSADATNSFSAGVSTPPSVVGSTVTVGVACVTVPCTVSAGLNASGAAANRDAHDTATAYGSATVTLTESGTQDVQIPLTPAGVSALQASGGDLAATLAESTAVGAYRQVQSTAVTLTAEVGTTGTSKTGTTKPGTRITAPALSRLRLSTRKLKTKLKITYRDSLAARTTFVVYVRRHRRWVKVGSFSHADHRGANVIEFTGEVGKRRLAPGDYQLRATPRADKRTGRTLTVTFTVLTAPVR